MTERILEIHRKVQIINELKRISIYINGKQVDTIGDGEVVQFEIDSEGCEVYAKIGWCKTKPLKITADDGDVVLLDLGCIVSGWPLYLFLLLLISFSLIFQSLCFIPLSCLPWIWYAFFQPSKYLYLKKKEA